VHVGPRPELVRAWKDAEIGNVDVGQRLVLDVPAFAEFALGKDDERDPRAQAPFARVGARGRVAPRKILVVELDVREVVRLEVRNVVARLDAHDRAPVDADDVAGAENRHGPALVDEFGAAADLRAVRSKRHRHFRANPDGVVEVVGLDLVGETLAHPGQERIGAERARHAAFS